MSLGIRRTVSMAARLASTAAGFCVLLFCASNSNTLICAESPTSAVPSFAKDVLPILRANCIGCHQDAKKLGGYLMTDFEGLLKGGESGSKAIVQGKSDESHLEIAVQRCH